MSWSTKLWVNNIFEKIGIVNYDCGVSYTKDICGIYDGYTPLRTMWDVYDDLYDNSVRPLTSWEYEDNGVYFKYYEVYGKRVLVGYKEDKEDVVLIRER